MYIKSEKLFGDGKMHEPKTEASIDDEFIVDYVRVFDEVK